MSASDDFAGPVHLREEGSTGDRFLAYLTAAGAEVELRVEGKSFWATQSQMASMFGVTVSAISKHLTNIFAEGELSEDSVVSIKAITAADGKSYRTKLYNLNALISVGYRIESKQGTVFRMWATDRLVQYLTKGFVIDAPRLKAPEDQDRIAELREIVRDIRASEAHVYAELRRICAMCQDYDPGASQSRAFYANMQAKLYWAVISGTPSMVLESRANANVANMGLQTWPKADIRQSDALNAKNYLTDVELRELNRLTAILLDIFEDQLEIGKLTLMAEASGLLDTQLRNLNRAVLRHGGNISHDDAVVRAKAEYAKFDVARREARRVAAEQALLQIRADEAALPKPKKSRSKKAADKR